MRVPAGSVSTALEVAGLALMAVVAWLWAPLAGLFVSGGLLVLLGYVLGVRTRL